MDSSTVNICWTCPFVIIEGVRSILSHLFYFDRKKILLANNVNPDQIPQYVASDLGLHCLPIYGPFMGFLVSMG